MAEFDVVKYSQSLDFYPTFFTVFELFFSQAPKFSLKVLKLSHALLEIAQSLLLLHGQLISVNRSAFCQNRRCLLLCLCMMLWGTSQIFTRRILILIKVIIRKFFISAFSYRWKWSYWFLTCIWYLKKFSLRALFLLLVVFCFLSFKIVATLLLILNKIFSVWELNIFFY